MAGSLVPGALRPVHRVLGYSYDIRRNGFADSSHVFTMGDIIEKKQIVQDLENLLQGPLSSAGARELTNRVSQLKEELKALEEARSQAIKDELNRLKNTSNDLLVSNLLCALIHIFDNPTNDCYAKLIQMLFNCELDTSWINLIDSPNDSNCDTQAKEKAKKCDRCGPEEITYNSLASSEETVKLNIWKVEWNNDTKYVRIYLPFRPGTVLITQITCKFFRVELGYRLEVNYPGARFIVLINHTNLEHKVEAKLGFAEITIRLTKRKSATWPYLTLLTINEEKKRAMYHLDFDHHLRVNLATDNFPGLISKEGLESMSDLNSHFKFIKRQFNIDPKPLLSKEASNRFCQLKLDFGYTVIN